MLRTESNEGYCKIEIKGSAADITADVLVIVNEVYKAFHKRDEVVADMFKESITDAVKDGVVFATKKEDIEKHTDDMVERRLKEIDKLISTLESLAKNN